MMSISNPPIYLRWQNSIPLAKAHEKLGSRTLRRHASTAPSMFAGISAAAALVARSLHRAPVGETDETTRNMHELTDAMRQGSEALSKLRKFILNKLTSGEYRAIGFQIGSAANEPPVEISARFFRMEWVKWEKDEIRSNDHAFDSVRIEISVASPKLIAPPEVVATAPKKSTGRPTVLNEIVAVAAGLHRRGLLAGKNSKERENTIRDECRKIHPLVFPKPTTPSKPKIYEALKQIGLMKK